MQVLTPATKRVHHLHSDLALMLTTSGSTGNPKLVRLSLSNIEANAASIAAYLELTATERAIQSLPLHYSYGLSLLNSHLLAGAGVVLTGHSFMRPEFWRDVATHACTSFAGVPYMYETLARLHFEPAMHTSIRSYTQAGGKLRSDVKSAIAGKVHALNGCFFAMYGQTEATARIAYVPPELLFDKLDAIGVAIPDGTLSLAADDVGEVPRELLYRGPNVMLGYAEGPDDLARGDEQRGLLHTGDLATQDGDGFFYLAGRLKRFAKLFGKRVSLDDVEQDVESKFGVQAAAVERADKLIVFFVPTEGVTPTQVVAHVARRLMVPPIAAQAVAADGIPRTTSGKKDYKQLEL
jgi:acyl-CoA synthetase (AMP-forming)/AMP-acid ligase II